MLTGQADLNGNMAAANRDSIFQFLTKPCPTEVLSRALDAALDQHRLLTAERELLELTLRSIGVLSDILTLVSPVAFRGAHRISRYVRRMVQKLDIPDQWQYELAAMLSQLGRATAPPELLSKQEAGQPLNADEAAIVASQDQVASNLLAKIPRLEDVAQMIALERTSWDAQFGDPDPVKIGAHLLRVALDFDEQLARGAAPAAVLVQMRRYNGYNPEFVAALEQVWKEEAAAEIRAVKVSELLTGMIVRTGIFAKNGRLLLADGHEITESAIARLNAFARTIGICEPVRVRVLCARSPGIAR
jgi:response regulator RpfG family c-di-GMP phosphodiesterase